MTSEIDQTSLTAYALGELSGAEHAAVAAHLVGNADARRFVADVRATAHLLADELARESFGGLTDLQHAAIEQRLGDAMRLPQAHRRVSRGVRWNHAVFAMSLAASIMIVSGVVAVLVPFVYQRLQFPSQQVAGPNRGPFPLQLKPDNLSVNPAVPERDGDKSETRFDHLASNDPNEAIVEEQWVPPPDNQLVKNDPGRESRTGADALIGNQPPVSVNPTPKAPVARGPEDAPANADAHHEPAVPVNPAVPHGKSSDNFAGGISIDEQSPDKLHNTVGSAPNGALPTGEQYAHLLENPWIDSADEPVSGFSAGVDTASYSNIRRFLTHGTLPPRDAVRIEEMLNYFPVRVADQAGEGPLVLQVELGACPWRPDRRLARVCVSARELPPLVRPPVNLVFLIDVSPSMRKERSKLPLLKAAIRQLTGKLSSRDRISLVAYSQEPGIVLPPTAGDDKLAIFAGLDRLDGGGKMSGGQGIEAAYELAGRNVSRGGTNRLILATDGNWNIGITPRGDLPAIIRDQARNNISLTVLGVGMDNLKDATLQKLAEAGNGSYAYVDTLAEGRKVLADQVNGALVTVAKNVKVQITFNPASAASYRLLGYERRALSKDELRSQSHPGGEFGAGQSVTALYEVIPVGKTAAARPAEMLTATVSYVEPTTHIASTVSTVGEDHATPLPRTSTEFRFAAAVAEFGLLLRNSDYKGNATYSSVLDHAHSAFGVDETGYRAEFVHLIKRAKELAANR